MVGFRGYRQGWGMLESHPQSPTKDGTCPFYAIVVRTRALLFSSQSIHQNRRRGKSGSTFAPWFPGSGPVRVKIAGRPVADPLPLRPAVTALPGVIVPRLPAVHRHPLAAPSPQRWGHDNLVHGHVSFAGVRSA